MTVEESSRYFLETFKLNTTQDEIINRIEEIVAENYRDTIPLKDGVLKLLNYLDNQGIPYGVATATYRTLATACLTRLHLINRIKFLETCSEIGKGKESPDIFYKCADNLQLSPKNIAVVEDSLYCLQTAKAYGFYTVAMHDNASQGDWEEIKNTADISFYSANELLEYLCS
jgi:HAD superfamily hydrolase (TIGR01509 family)